jgi:hypothetical protein
LTAIDVKTDALMVLLDPPSADSPSKVDLLLELAQQQAELLADLVQQVAALKVALAATTAQRP